MARARTVFLGTGAFAVPVATTVVNHPSVELVAVVTAPERVGSRGKSNDPPIAIWAAEHDFPTLRPGRLRSDDSLAEIEALEPDLLVLADYGQIVPARLLDLPRHGALNLHPSLLPRYRGATPIPAAILAGDKETGVTLMRMTAGLDTGPILAQLRAAIEPEEVAPQLEARLATLAGELLANTLDRWLAGQIEPQQQDDARASLTKPLRREDGRLDRKKTAAELERQVRAYQPWPGSFVETNAGRLIVWQAGVGEERGQLEIGALVSGSSGLTFVASDRLLELVQVQLAGSRPMNASDLLRGHPRLTIDPRPADTGA